MGGMTKQTELPDVPKDDVMLKSGSKGDSVLELKRKLIALGYELTPTNNLFGMLTETAVKDFQTKHGLVVDGIVGPLTQAALDVALEALKTAPVVVGAYTHVHPITWARGELGQKEILGKADNPRIRWYHTHCANIGSKEHPDEVPWCSSFVNAAADECGMEKTDNALAVSWRNYGTDSGDLVEEGDIVVLGTRHVTLANAPFNRKTDKTFAGLGGNQGNACKVSTYSVAEVSAARKWKPKPGTVTAPIVASAGKLETENATVKNESTR
jgi:uncharacterized protein (TIGR02594 family)